MQGDHCYDQLEGIYTNIKSPFVGEVGAEPPEKISCTGESYWNPEVILNINRSPTRD